MVERPCFVDKEFKGIIQDQLLLDIPWHTLYKTWYCSFARSSNASSSHHNEIVLQNKGIKGGGIRPHWDNVVISDKVTKFSRKIASLFITSRDFVCQQPYVSLLFSFPLYYVSETILYLLSFCVTLYASRSQECGTGWDLLHHHLLSHAILLWRSFYKLLTSILQLAWLFYPATEGRKLFQKLSALARIATF